MQEAARGMKQASSGDDDDEKGEKRRIR